MFLRGVEPCGYKGLRGGGRPFHWGCKRALACGCKGVGVQGEWDNMLGQPYNME
jgi:hypothetical protein